METARIYQMYCKLTLPHKNDAVVKFNIIISQSRSSLFLNQSFKCLESTLPVSIKPPFNFPDIFKQMQNSLNIP